MEINKDLYHACQIVAAESGITLSKSLLRHTKSFNDFLLAANFSSRAVVLESTWWEMDHGPLLAFRKKDNKATPLIFSRWGYYESVDPETYHYERITGNQAQDFESQAYYFYVPFPDKLNLSALFKFIRFQFKNDFVELILLQFFISILMLLIPIAMSTLFSQVIPNADNIRLAQWIFALAINTVIVTLLNINIFLFTIRLRFRINVASQAALWDRLLHLPMDFFRKFTVGDLSLTLY